MMKKGCINNSFVTGAKRRNIPVTYKTVVLVPYYDGYKNVLTQDMINEENIKYVIKYDYWLNGETITIPENSILEFDGGSLHDGTIIGQSTFINDVGGLGLEKLFAEDIIIEGTWRTNGGQIQSDWNQNDSFKKDFIKNKPNLANVATSGSYTDLINTPVMPAEQVQADWNQTDSQAKDFIKNKPTLAKVAASGSYNDLNNKPTIPEGVTVDTALSKTSTNPVQNKVITKALEESGNIDKSYDITKHSGLGRKILKLKEDDSNVLTQEDFDAANTIYVIQYDFTLGEDITVPENCVLEFDGGSISGNKTLTGNNTGISAGLVKIFNTDVTLAGTWNIINVYPEWFGAKGIDNDTYAIRKALVLGTGHTVVFSRSKTYKLYDLVEVFSNTEIIIDGVIDNTLYGCFEFFSRTVEQPGYTGVSNVYIHGNGIFNCNGYLDLDGSIGTATPFRIAHCTNITVEGLTIKDHKYHCVEISGSKNVYLKNIKFLGNAYNSVSGINEAIQLERVSEGGAIGAIPYDYTIAKDVTIDSCVFSPSENSVYMGKAIGSHDGINSSEKLDSETFSNITIKNCIFKNIPNVPGDPWVINLDSNYRDVCIKDNIFDNIFERCIYVGVYTDGVIIKDNVFQDLTQAVININADSNVDIKSNKFIKCAKYSNTTPIVYNSTKIKNYGIVGNYVELANEEASKPFHMPSSAYSPSVVFKDNIIANVSILTQAARQDLYEQLSRFEYRSESAPMGRNYTLYYTDMPSVTTKGTTANRPKAWLNGNGILSKDSNIGIGFTYFDTDLGKPIYVKDIDSSNNVIWVDATGTQV